MNNIKAQVIRQLRAVKTADETSRALLEQVIGSLMHERTVVGFQPYEPESVNNIPTYDLRLHNID